MATGKRYYWLKLKDAFMNSDTVDYFMEQPNGANYVVLYQMLCLKTINTNGRLSRQIGEVIIPYDVEKITRDLKWFSVDTVRVALNLYRAFGLIYEDQDGTLVLSDHQNLVGSETDYAEKKARQRRQLPSGDNSGDNVPTNVPIDKDIRDKILEKDNRGNAFIINNNISYGSENNISVDKKDNTTSPQAEVVNCPFEKIKELYHSICISFPRIVKIEGNRKTAVAARWRSYRSIETFEKIFTLAEESAFLKGENDRNWHADFDWMMNATNFSKILENKYNRTSSGEHKLTGALGTLARMYKEAGNDGTGNN